MAGAPEGNKNAAKGKAWADALRAELAQFEDHERKIERGHALRAIARKVVAKAIDGDKDAMKEIGDRLDGKPSLTVTGPDNSDLFGTLMAAMAEAARGGQGGGSGPGTAD